MAQSLTLWSIGQPYRPWQINTGSGWKTVAINPPNYLSVNHPDSYVNLCSCITNNPIVIAVTSDHKVNKPDNYVTYYLRFMCQSRSVLACGVGSRRSECELAGMQAEYTYRWVAGYYYKINTLARTAVTWMHTLVTSAEVVDPPAKFSRPHLVYVTNTYGSSQLGLVNSVETVIPG